MGRSGHWSGPMEEYSLGTLTIIHYLYIFTQWAGPHCTAAHRENSRCSWWPVAPADPDLSKSQIPQIMVVMETELQVRKQLNSKGQLCHTRVLYTHNYHNHNYMHYMNEPEILCNHLLSCLCNVICNIFTRVNLVTLSNIHAMTPEKQFNITMCKAWLGTNFTQRHFFGNA